MRYSTATTIRQTILAREKSCVETITDALTHARKVQDRCNAFTALFDDEALAQARGLDDALNQSNEAGLLHGVPIVVKDMTPTKGQPTTLGSLTSGDTITDHDAVVVERLKKAGAIVIGKTTTAEFAFSAFTRSLRYGKTLNPWNQTRTAGGSSGGSAVAVACGVVPLAEGTDMGGSVRIPAAACGVVGLKPSLGRIPMTIMPPAFETYSHFGPLARSVKDAALFVAATAGHHPKDMLSLTERFDLAACDPASLAGKRFALSIDLGYCEVDEDVTAALYETAERLRQAGAKVEEVDLPWTPEVFDQWAKRWNVVLGLFPNCKTEEELDRLDPELATCIRTGRNMSASELLEVDVFRAKMNDDLNAIFDRFDALLCPTNAIPAPSLSDSDNMYERILPSGKLRTFDMAHPFNMVPTCPAISLPVGLSRDGLPIGLQIVGRAHQNEDILAVAASAEMLLDPLPTLKI